MSGIRLYLAVAAFIGVSFLGGGIAGGSLRADLAAQEAGKHADTDKGQDRDKDKDKDKDKDRDKDNDKDEDQDRDNDRAIGSPVTVLETDLVADVPTLIDRYGIVHVALHQDPHLANAWGIAESATSPFWVADNNAGVSTLYNTAGTPQSLVVSIPSPVDPLNPTGAPTGAVFNQHGGVLGGFKISGVSKSGQPASAPAVFLFATEDGTIVGWNPGVNPPGFDPTKAGTYGVIAVDNSANPTVADGAVYKGLAMATDTLGNAFLYATNFRAGAVEVYDASFHPVTLPPDAFTDPMVAHDYAPFNIVLANGVLFVTYAKQDKAKHDDVAGRGHGFVDTFDLSGHLLSRFARRGQLNSPWGLAVAPASFGQFAGAMLIGNFGNGRIHAFDPVTGAFLGTATNTLGQVILIDGLWSLQAGNGGNGGDRNTIYFTAGPNGEKDGLFGSLTPVAPGTPCGVPCR